MQFTDQNAFVIHTRDFSEKQKVIIFLSEKLGNFSALAIRNKKKTTPKLFEWYKISGQLKENGLGKIFKWHIFENYQLTKTNLFHGLYVNEFVHRVFQNHQHSTFLFHSYQQTLANLIQYDDGKTTQMLLRKFEWNCFRELGVAPNLECDKNNETIYEHKWYKINQHGVVKDELQKSPNAITGNIVKLYSIFLSNQNSANYLYCLKELTKFSAELKYINRILVEACVGKINFNSKKLFTNII